MKKKTMIWTMAAAMVCAMGLNAYAADSSVTFTEAEKLEYSGTLGSGEEGVILGSFDQVAPGDTVTQTITLKNTNELTVDFYMSARTLTALEEAVAEGQTAGGAAYEITLTAGETSLYDSSAGGYLSEERADGVGLKKMNDALGEYILVGTLAKEQALDIRMMITFDGEAMDNTQGGIDYSNTLGKIAFDFMVSYEEPAGPTIVYNDVERTEAPTVITRIMDQLVPLASVQTGDAALTGGAAVILIAGIVLIVLSCRKKKVEEES